MNNVLVNLENGAPDGYTRAYYFGFKYIYREQDTEDLSPHTDYCAFTGADLKFMVDRMKDWIIGEPTSWADKGEDVLKILDMDFYYLDLLEGSSEFNDLEFGDTGKRISTIHNKGVDASPLEYQALRRELYIND